MYFAYISSLQREYLLESSFETTTMRERESQQYTLWARIIDKIPMGFISISK
jgi:hypothetical protein